VNGWRAAFLALALSIAPAARAAEDLNGAARELARKTAAAIGRGEPVAVAWRNLSSLGTAGLAQARGAFEAALREAGSRPGDPSPVADAQITISENASSYLLVEEVRKEVWIASWKRTPSGPAHPIAVLEKRLLWEQEEPILDAVLAGDSLLILTPAAVVRTSPRQTAPIPPLRSWPRDLRGHLRVNGAGIQAYLPGAMCSGSTEPELTIACKQTEEPWTLESGSRSILLAQFAANRNYFDGRVVTQNALRKSVPPFYSAASADEGGRPLWLLTTMAGRTEMFDAAMEPVGSIPSWGSDVAGIETRCGGASIVFATQPGEGPDAIQAFAIANRAAVAVAQPLALPGPVTALWSSGMAIVHNASTGKYEAYAITVTCGS
jgi:hypothetical protein